MVYIVGKGRVGSGLSKLSPKSKIFGRGESFDELGSLNEEDLVLLCTRNDDLAELIQSLPKSARSKVVLVQNGMLSPFIEKLEDQPAARAILYFAVPKLGDLPMPGGNTLVCGPKAEELKGFFESVDIPSQVVNDDEMARVEMEKLLWNALMGLMGQYYNESVRETLDKHWSEVLVLLGELLPVISQSLEIDFEKSELEISLKSYSEEVDYYSARVKEWEWRNAWFFKAIENTKVSAPNWERYHKELTLV